MSLFIPIYVQLTPQSESFNLTDPVLVEVQAPSVVQAPLRGYRQVSEDIGGLPTLPYPLPGSSIRNPIDVDALSDTETNTSAYSHDMHRPGDSIENPIEIDAVSVETSDATEIIASLRASPAQTELAPDGRSLQEYYECKICYSKVVDLALGCGHTFCYDCFTKAFHVSVLRQAGGSHELARLYLASRECEPVCFACKKARPGQYTDPEDRAHLEGSHFLLRCQEGCSHCFTKDYMVQGVILRML